MIVLIHPVALVQQFLDSTSHQLTDYGLEQLHKALEPVNAVLVLPFNLIQDELVVFFRNNHFSTLTLHDGLLYNLVSDLGYERERNVVWDLLASVLIFSCFADNVIRSLEIHNSSLATLDQQKRPRKKKLSILLSNSGSRRNKCWRPSNT